MQKLGTFQIENGVVISDPCYEFNVDEYKKGLDIMKYFPKQYVMIGEWNGYVKYDDESGRVAILRTSHSSITDEETNNMEWQLCKGTLGVDSGQLGVFDSKYFKDDNIVGDYPLAKYITNLNEKGQRFYAMCCQQTYDEKNPKKRAGIIPFGVVSSSGYGDGCYNYSVIKKNGIICGFEIVFIDPDECSNSDCSF